MVTAEILHFELSWGFMLSQVLMEVFPFLTPTTLESPWYAVHHESYSRVLWISKSDMVPTLKTRVFWPIKNNYITCSIFYFYLIYIYWRVKKIKSRNILSARYLWRYRCCGKEVLSWSLKDDSISGTRRDQSDCRYISGLRPKTGYKGTASLQFPFTHLFLSWLHKLIGVPPNLYTFSKESSKCATAWGQPPPLSIPPSPPQETLIIQW